MGVGAGGVSSSGWLSFRRWRMKVSSPMQGNRYLPCPMCERRRHSPLGAPPSVCPPPELRTAYAPHCATRLKNGSLIARSPNRPATARCGGRRVQAEQSQATGFVVSALPAGREAAEERTVSQSSPRDPWKTLSSLGEVTCSVSSSSPSCHRAGSIQADAPSHWFDGDPTALHQ